MNSCPMYILDFETMRQVMQEHQKTGGLYADIPSGVASLREPCRVEVKIISGVIASCSIIGNSGRRVLERDIVGELLRLGQLCWTFTPLQEHVTPEVPPASAVTVQVCPQRIAQVGQGQMSNWPRIHRMIFALVDGTRSVLKIAAILSISPEIVDGVLREWQSAGIIVMGSGEKKHS